MHGEVTPAAQETMSQHESTVRSPKWAPKLSRITPLACTEQLSCWFFYKPTLDVTVMYVDFVLDFPLKLLWNRRHLCWDCRSHQSKPIFGHLCKCAGSDRDTGQTDKVVSET